MIYVVIAMSPAVDTSIVVGPYTSSDAATEASANMEHKGYTTEICQLWKVSDIDNSPAWEGS